MRIGDWSADVCSSDLSGLLSGLRRQGAGYLNTGAFANRFVAAANGIGLPLTSQGLRETLPRVTAPLTLPYGDSVAYFPPGGGGVPTAQLWPALPVVEDYAGASAAGRAHLLAEAGQRVFAARGGRSAERRGGQAGVRTVRIRSSPHASTKNNN